jgi:multiple antibiotic resistance protein
MHLVAKAGRGSIAVAITFGSKRPQEAMSLGAIALILGGALTGVTVLAATIYVCYRYAEGVTAVLGHSGTNVLVRLSAFILLCIGIAVIWSGASALLGIAKP